VARRMHLSLASARAGVTTLEPVPVSNGGAASAKTEEGGWAGMAMLLGRAGLALGKWRRELGNWRAGWRLGKMKMGHVGRKEKRGERSGLARDFGPKGILKFEKTLFYSLFLI
jgi:hypothetical protein